MAKLTAYAAVTTLNESMLFYTAIDTNADTVFESKKLTLATLRGALFDTNGVIFKESKGADVASANALSLGSDGNYFDITGTTAITSIDTIQIGTEVTLQFDGAVTLTHHATNLILPSGANIETAAGDHLTFREYDTGKWRCTAFVKASALPVFQSTAGETPTILTGAMTIVTDSAAVPVTNYYNQLVTTVAAVPTLADGVERQLIKLQMIVDGGDAVLTPANLNSGTTITFADVGDTAELMFSGGAWKVLALYNVVDGATAPVLA